MLIEKLISDYDSSYIYLERYVNDGSPSKIDNTTSLKTSPKSKYKYLTLKQIDFGENYQYEDFGNFAPSSLLPHSIPVHPDMIGDPLFKDYIDEALICGGIRVFPTASGRTTKICDSPYYIKISYSKLLGRIPRIINRKNLKASCETTAILMGLINEGKVGPQFSILREDSGRIVYLRDNVEWGACFREYRPYPYISDTEYMIPFFSLFGKDVNEKSDLPLLVQLFNKQNKSPEQFLLEDILKPLYRTYFEALIYGGIELEAHAQNMLLTINKDFQIQRIVCRDLESAGRDLPLIRRISGNTTFESYPYKCNEESDEVYSNGYTKYTITHSFMFDFKLGEYIVTPIINCASLYLNINREHVIDEIRRFNRSFIKLLPLDFFPKEWCYYSNIVWGDRKREYIWEDNPHYR